MKIDHQSFGTVDVCRPIGALVDEDAERFGADLRARGEGLARLKLVGVPPTCREIFEITGLSNHFQFFESVEDAVRSFL